MLRHTHTKRNMSQQKIKSYARNAMSKCQKQKQTAQPAQSAPRRKKKIITIIIKAAEYKCQKNTHKERSWAFTTGPRKMAFPAAQTKRVLTPCTPQVLASVRIRRFRFLYLAHEEDSQAEGRTDRQMLCINININLYFYVYLGAQDTRKHSRPQG